MAVVLKSTITPSRSEAVVSIGADGSVVVSTSAVEMGQGSAATMAELAAGQLQVPAEDVQVARTDTASTPYDKVTSSSRTTSAVGIAVERACQDVCRQLGELQRGAPAPARAGRRPDWGAVVRAAGLTEVVGHGVYESAPGAGELDPDTSQGMVTDHWHQGAVTVEVEVDTDTGRVEVVAAHGASYAGRVVDPLRARKQTEGGMIFGLGPALFEELRYDGGEPATTTLSDYEIPSILDVPVRIGSTVLQSSGASGPHGLGENTVPPMAPAVANAVAAACGARVRDLPLTAEKVLRALHDRWEL